MTPPVRPALLSRIVRFGLVGAVNTGVYYGLYRALWLISPYLVAHVVAFLGAMVVSYFLNCRFTFRIRPSWRTFLLFPLSNATNFCVQTLGLYLLVDLLGMSERYAPLPAAAVAIPVTFIVAQAVMLGRQAVETPQDTEDEPSSAELVGSQQARQ